MQPAIVGLMWISHVRSESISDRNKEESVGIVQFRFRHTSIVRCEKIYINLAQRLGTPTLLVVLGCVGEAIGVSSVRYEEMGAHVLTRTIKIHVNSAYRI